MKLEAEAIAGIPEVAEGADLGALIAAAAELGSTDVVVISQKIVSKAEGRIRELAAVEPGQEALETAARLGKDPRLVELVLREAESVLRAERGVLIVRTHSGLVCANAGVDTSNVPGTERVALLPEDPDASARRIRAEIRATAGVAPAIVLADSFGRPWRLGQADVAIGCAGLVPLDDWRGREDRDGQELEATAIAVADEAAAAADLARDKASGMPVVIVRSLDRFITAEDGPGAAALRRNTAEDLFS